MDTMETALRLAGVIRESIVDGPGWRFVVFAQGCPKGVRISSAFEAYNSCLRFDQMADLRARIQSCGIADCIECGKCEGHCPQHIAIPKELKRVLACAEAEAIG